MNYLCATSPAVVQECQDHCHWDVTTYCQAHCRCHRRTARQILVLGFSAGTSNFILWNIFPWILKFGLNPGMQTSLQPNDAKASALWYALMCCKKVFPNRVTLNYAIISLDGWCRGPTWLPFTTTQWHSFSHPTICLKMWTARWPKEATTVAGLNGFRGTCLLKGEWVSLRVPYTTRVVGLPVVDTYTLIPHSFACKSVSWETVRLCLMLGK